MTTPPLNLRDYEPLARERLSQAAYEYYASGATDEITVRENHSAYERLKLRPRMMRPVGTRTTQTILLGQAIPAPLLIAPMAMMKLAHPDGEIGMARAALRLGLTMIVSTSATTALDAVFRAAPGNHWFQLYMSRDREFARWLVEQAESVGYNALVLTADRPILGRREADIRNNFTLPPGLELGNLRLSGNAAYDKDDLFEENLQWSDITWLRSITSLPILVKGILRGDDAWMAVEHGASGIIVSNHGGRQLDTTPATIEVLPEIVAAVGHQVDVLVDGGIRRGTDMLKALALGARAVCLGRPALWGLAANGEAGVNHVLDLLLAEFDQTMALCGCSTISDITPDLIWNPPGSGR
jgi:4-hydroxymandelate oxidase